jgi:excisionase family DNA binding protein
MPNQALTLPKAAEFMGLSHASIYKLVAVGKIPYRKQGRRLLFLKCELEQYLLQLPGLSLEAIKSPKDTAAAGSAEG